MKKNKIFIACDTTNIKKIREIINKTQISNLKVGYKFGLEFLNSKNGRSFVSKMKNKTVFADLKLHDIPNTCASTIKAIKDLTKLVDIILYEVQESLKRGERVELRDIFSLDPRIQKEGIRRNPKTGEKVFVKEKKSVLFKMSKEWANKIDEKE